MDIELKMKPLHIIYRGLGLEDKGKVQVFLGKRVADSLKKYVSFKSGTQQASVDSINGGRQVIINVPYAQFQAGGKVMIGIHSNSPWARRGERKVLTNKNLIYHNGGLRGARPFERMKADKRESILSETAKFARGCDDG